MNALRMLRRTRRSMYRGQSCLGWLIAALSGRAHKRVVNVWLGRTLHSKGWWR